MYKTPFEKIYSEIQTQMAQEDENMVMEAIRKVGINVDKEELIKALQYDRNQYTKGYDDGKNDVLDKIKAEIEHLTYYWCEISPRSVIDDVLQIINKYMEESGSEE